MPVSNAEVLTLFVMRFHVTVMLHVGVPMPLLTARMERDWALGLAAPYSLTSLWLWSDDNEVAKTAALTAVFDGVTFPSHEDCFRKNMFHLASLHGKQDFEWRGRGSLLNRDSIEIMGAGVFSFYGFSSFFVWNTWFVAMSKSQTSLCPSDEFLEYLSRKAMPLLVYLGHSGCHGSWEGYGKGLDYQVAVVTLSLLSRICWHGKRLSTCLDVATIDRTDYTEVNSFYGDFEGECCRQVQHPHQSQTYDLNSILTVAIRAITLTRYRLD
ncbi:hypothetical protein ACRALDRAFT_212212 [Sodiomyces alcalophilus JCM 7366]|uniref:uncharacterized protein n=1 Tax=Sodiomyces alcalophilus JCM 7366 TaxID=591952 RepID=UPI0039B4E39C